MSSTWFAAVLAFAAGLGGAVQIAVQGRLGERVGSLEALTTAAVVGGLIALTALLLVRRSVGGVGEASLDQNGNYLVEPWVCSSCSRSPLRARASAS